MTIPYIVGIRYRSRRGSIRFHDNQECDTEANKQRFQCLPPPCYPIPDYAPEAQYNCDACGKALRGDVDQEKK